MAQPDSPAPVGRSSEAAPAEPVMAPAVLPAAEGGLGSLPADWLPIALLFG